MENFYEASEKKRKTMIEQINKKCSKEGINVEVVIGSEIYITDKILELLKNNEASPIGWSKYILMETPMDNLPMNFNNIVDDLIRKGYKVVLAHPERYRFVKDDPTIVEKFQERGIYMQCNYASILGKYGKEAKKTLTVLLKHHLVQFMGSDAHRRLYTYPDIEKAKKKIINLVGEEYFESISNTNAELVLKNKEVEIEEEGNIEKTIFGYK